MVVAWGKKGKKTPKSDTAIMRFHEKKHSHREQNDSDTAGKDRPSEAVGLRDRIAHFTWYV